jgi:hypothetical protein
MADDDLEVKLVGLAMLAGASHGTNRLLLKKQRR